MHQGEGGVRPTGGGGTVISMSEGSGSPAGHPRLPTGTVTFLMTDVEGSTRLLRELGDAYADVLDAQHRLLAEACASAGGTRVSTEGDGAFFVFPDAAAAIGAASDAQRRLAAHSWPSPSAVRVRMGLHTGNGRLLGDTYVGLDVHRVARIAAAAHGGQVVVSAATRALADMRLPEDVRFVDIGEHRLKDLEHPERLYQLVADGLPGSFPPLRSLGSDDINLPTQLTTFVGRARDKERLLELLGNARILTLTGPGGTGKTRLSLEVATEAAKTFDDGAHFVPLAPLSDPDLVLPTVAGTLGVREASGRPIRDGLVEHLRNRSLLLVLDNFEQVMPAAPAVADLVANAPRLKVVVSSREPLRVSGEHEFPVPPLDVPRDPGATRLDELRAVDSIVLFEQRARAVRPTFELTADNARAVADICVRLDGLPLAIELAAARVRLFEPADILGRLDRRLSFLAGGRDVTERQRTLRGTIDWSHELLDDREQVVFRRISVFADGSTIEAIEAVCRPDEVGLDATDVVSSLHDKSLLRRDDTVGVGLRVGMLETIREYGLERLEAAGEAPDLRRRHALHYLTVAEETGGRANGPGQQRLLEELDVDLDNFRTAIRWAIEAGDVEAGVRLASALNTFWVFRNHLKEGRRLVAELLRLPVAGVPKAVRARALSLAADLAAFNADYPVAEDMSERSLALFRELGDVAGIAGSLSNLGWATATTDPDRALGIFAESIAAYREIGAPRPIGHSLIGIAMPEMKLGQLDVARGHLEEASALFHGLEDEGIALIADGLLGICSRLQGDLVGARRRYLAVLSRGEVVSAHIALALPFMALADLALLEGDAEGAAVLDGAQAKLGEQLGGTPGFELMGVPKVADRARAALGDERYEAAAARGRRMPIDEAIAFARGDATPSAT